MMIPKVAKMKSFQQIFTLVLLSLLLKNVKGGCPANSKSLLRNDQKLCIELYKVGDFKEMHF